MDMQKTYNPKDFEDRIYREWEENGYFHAKADKNKKPFTIMMPPPNITGQLHMGHAMDNTLQDTIIRFKRMQGYDALWLPGTDHASIATEVKIVKKLQEEGVTKHDLGREGFLAKAWEWKAEYGGRITQQLRKMGSSCDWQREAFTMDERCSKAVREVFVNLYEKGLIYQGDRIVNWCPKCQSAISDMEAEYYDEDSAFWHLRYFLADGSGRSVVVATTRPETMFGDTAVAVNPEDPRYKDMIGQNVILPLVNKEIPIVGDEHADMTFGTGCVKITPAHDPNDFEVGKRHNLEIVRVMNYDGTMNALAGKYEGMDRYECRKQVVADLEASGNLVKIEPHKHSVGHCYRHTDTAVEPIVSKQWFVKMEPLAKPAVEAVKKHKIRFVPKRFEKTYFNWMENIKDWCISRQLWWGHRIPVWYCADCGKDADNNYKVSICSKTDPTVCPVCGGTHLLQDEDVLDTWFSSALWPFSTLGFPEATEELAHYYPTNVLVTGYDIIFFWVARMIFSGIEHMQEVPFKDVLIHGIVRDSQGRKMSKSLGNGIDPLVVIDKYGADSLRLSLLTGVAPGNDTRYQEEKVEASRNFINKLWNASRFVLMNMDGTEILPLKKIKLAPADKWIMHRLQSTIKTVTTNLDRYELGVALGAAVDFVWDDFCDWYIELSKPALYGESLQKKQNTLSVLCYVLENALKLLHPFIPFVTEEIYGNLPTANGTIMLAQYPVYDSHRLYTKDAKAFESVMEIIKGVRGAKTNVNCPPSKKVKLYFVTENKDYIRSNADMIMKLAGASEVLFADAATEIGEKTVSLAVSGASLYIPLGELVDIEKEKERLTAEITRVQGEIKRAQGMLSNERFVAKAPKDKVEAERAKIVKYNELLATLTAQLADLQ